MKKRQNTKTRVLKNKAQTKCQRRMLGLFGKEKRPPLPILCPLLFIQSDAFVMFFMFVKTNVLLQFELYFHDREGKWVGPKEC